MSFNKLLGFPPPPLARKDGTGWLWLNQAQQTNGTFVRSHLAKVTRMHALRSFDCLSTWVARICAKLML